MKVGFGSADFSRSVKDENGVPAWGGSGWARLGQYVGKLQYEVVAGPLCEQGDVFGVKDWATGEMHFDCDIIVMQRVMFSDIPEKMMRARANGQILINDVDDWYWGLSPANAAWLASHPVHNPEENVNHYKRILHNSSVVTVSTRYLADRISQWVTSPIVILGNYIDTSMYYKKSHSMGKYTIGWAGSTQHRSGDLEILKGVISQIDDANFCHIGHLEGAPLFADRVGLPEDKVKTYPMVTPREYPISLLHMDVGLAPLANVPFNEAKSAIKMMEYSAAGIPSILSPLPEYKRLHELYGIGRIAKKPNHWVSHVKALKDPDVRVIEGDLAYTMAERYFDTYVGVALWNDVLSTVSS